MKKIFFLTAALLISAAVFAQPPGGGPGGFGGPQMMGMDGGITISDPAEQAEEFVAQIKDSLQLTDKQEKSLIKLYTNHYSKMQTLKAQISEQEKYTEQRLSSEILTAEQAAKWKVLKKQLKRGNRDSDSQSEGNFGGFMPGMMPPGGGPGGPM